ncbi:related to homeodomain transcription factor bE2 [Ustilago trichophora]|uniref:Related to homeodomain transcription factor bE2 n=1 Tax=Ustilago trichophora TaxID=86804 RepID=A0A5C3DPR5_9BASI|nr:related to homeodomain transcription factor bE2 [Ustilago trichophora]
MTNSAPDCFTDMLQAIRDIEEEFLHQGSDCSDVALKLSALQERTAAMNPPGSIEQDFVMQIHQAALRIQVVAGARLRIEEAFGNLQAEMLEDADRALTRAVDCHHPLQPQDLSETLPSYHMRKHFLATLDDPYPTQDDKEALVSITNETASVTGSKYLNVHQLTLWFINARRRSGWSQILRKFARDDRQRMKLLVQTKMLSTSLPIRTEPLPSVLTHNLDDVLCDNLGRKLTPADKKAFEEDWASMISWIKYGVKEKVGSWVHDLVAANKKPGQSPGKKSQPRTVTTAANRTPARKAHTTTKAKPRQAKQRASTTSSVDSGRDTSVLESTPELSMCSTADTSFSSLSSNLSMLQYDPFAQRSDILQSPTLNAKGGRKVKALPKRVQKLTSEPLYTNETAPSTSTCFTVPETHTQVNAQTTSSLPLTFLPPYDALGQAPMPIRRESLSSNSLSAAFG